MKSAKKNLSENELKAKSAMKSYTHTHTHAHLWRHTNTKAHKYMRIIKAEQMRHSCRKGGRAAEQRGS